MAEKDKDKKTQSQGSGSANQDDNVFELGDVQAMNLRGDEINVETKKILDKQPKQRITIPRLQGNKAPKYLDIGVNGAIFRCPRGKPIEVPQSIAEAYYASMASTE